jgi:hypothetical protein
MELIYEVYFWDDPRWHDMHTRFHEDWFGHSGNCNVITLTIWEVVVLALLMIGIYYVRRWVGLSWHDMHTEFHDDGFRNLSNVKGITSTIREDIVLVLLTREIYHVRHWHGLRWHNIGCWERRLLGTSCERAAPLAEKNAAARYHVLRSLISLHNEHRI